jgi:hypothetical protein
MIGAMNATTPLGEAFVHAAELELEDGTDAGSPGAAVTTALFRAEEGLVRTLIDRALRTAGGWSVRRTSVREVAAGEQALATRLLSTAHL